MGETILGKTLMRGMHRVMRFLHGVGGRGKVLFPGT